MADLADVRDDHHGLRVAVANLDQLGAHVGGAQVVPLLPDHGAAELLVGLPEGLGGVDPVVVVHKDHGNAADALVVVDPFGQPQRFGGGGGDEVVDEWVLR